VRSLAVAIALSACAPAIALSACAPAYSLATRRQPPIYLFAADVAAFSAGMMVGIDEYNAHPEQRNNALMWGGFGLAALFWLPYWLPTGVR
jgi:hypothetical protein